MLPLLSAFTARLRSRINQQSLTASMAASTETEWPQLGATPNPNPDLDP